MIELWIPFTIAAAFFQNARSALQKHLKGRLTTLGAAYVRFLYACPFAVIYVYCLNEWGEFPLPATNGLFFLYCVLGGLSQILFTVILLYLFSFRNFAVGTTFSKTEVILIALLGFLIIGDTLTLQAAIAMVVAVTGVLILSAGQSKLTLGSLLSNLTSKSTLIGLTCGAFLGASVVFFRAASLSLNYDGTIMAAGFTLAVSIIFQTAIMGIYLFIKERSTLSAVFHHWPWSLAVGIAGVLASIGWFTAFTLQNGAYVRALGQIELVFTFLVSTLFFRERFTRLEVIGILLIILGIVILMLSE